MFQKTSVSAVNRVVLESIPIQRDLKRYWVRKFQRMCLNNGRQEAERKFKHLKEVILLYLSDSDRHQHMQDYYDMSGFRTNSYLRRLYLHADCQPHYLLDLICMYSYCPRTKGIPQWGTPESPWDLAKASHERLSEVNVDTKLPVAMQDWLDVISLNQRETKELYYCLERSTPEERALASVFSNRVRPKVKAKFFRDGRLIGSSFRHFVSHHSISEWMSYWSKWSAILRKAWMSKSDPDYRKAVEDARHFWPSVYKDYVQRQYPDISGDKNKVASELGWSMSFDLDYDNLSAMCSQVSRYVGSPLSREQLSFVISFLSDELQESLNDLLSGNPDWRSLVPELEQPRTICGSVKDRVYPYEIHRGQFVGHIHHIAKKGAGSSWRDIAVPNRFIQEALVPLWGRLRMFQKLLPTDASLDQARFDRKITNRVTNSNLYVGSVDLSKATDNLPFVWAEHLINVLVKKWGWSSEVESKSYDLFKTVARGDWEDQGFLSSWKVGQPLGSIPSFGFLTLTHWFICESLSLSCGLGHSPYAIVGDDLVCFNKKLRKRYISTLTSRRVPLSLHKSFDGRLTEFAGKTYVQNCVPFFTTDQSILTWNSLFDYQVATGVRIPWNNLPKKLKRKWTKVQRDLDPSSKVRPSQTYHLSMELLVPNRGSSIRRDISVEDAVIQAFEEQRYTLESEKDQHSADEHYTGIVQLGGHPVTLLNTKFSDKDGWFSRYREVQLPEWYRDKYRVCSTDHALESALYALRAASKQAVC